MPSRYTMMPLIILDDFLLNYALISLNSFKVPQNIFQGSANVFKVIPIPGEKGFVVTPISSRYPQVLSSNPKKPFCYT